MAIEILYPLVPRFLLRRANPDRFAIQQLVELAARNVESGELILDAGAGPCQYRPFFGHASYLAGDFMRADERYGRMDVFLDVGRLPFRGNSLAAILCVEVLEHVEHPAVVLQQFWHALKPGGSLFLAVPLGGPGLHEIPFDYNRFTPFSLKRLLEEAGFETLNLEPRGGYFWEMGYMFRLLPRTVLPGVFTRSLSAGGVVGKAFLFPQKLLFGLLELFFVLLLPLLCFYLDGLDRDKHHTLGYNCWCRKASS